jgi:hypothetical protein
LEYAGGCLIGARLVGGSADETTDMPETYDQHRKVETIELRLARQTRTVGTILTVILVPLSFAAAVVLTFVVGDVLDWWDILDVPWLVNH